MILKKVRQATIRYGKLGQAKRKTILFEQDPKLDALGYSTMADKMEKRIKTAFARYEKIPVAQIKEVIIERGFDLLTA